jgi:hypothetical protein
MKISPNFCNSVNSETNCTFKFPTKSIVFFFVECHFGREKYPISSSSCSKVHCLCSVGTINIFPVNFADKACPFTIISRCRSSLWSKSVPFPANAIANVIGKHFLLVRVLGFLDHVNSVPFTVIYRPAHMFAKSSPNFHMQKVTKMPRDAEIP